jgi:drug/metabolite transporter (DMT)-like permease
MNLYTLAFILLETGLMVSLKSLMTQGLHPYFLVFGTGVFSSIFLWFWLVYKKQVTRANFNIRSLKYSLPSALFFGLANILGFLGLKLTTATNYALISRSSVIFLPLLGWWLIKEKTINAIYPLGLLIIIGIWLLSGNNQILIHWSGDGLAILSALTAALDFIYQKKALQFVAKDIIAWWRRIVSCIIGGIIWLFTPALGAVNANYLPLIALLGLAYFLISLALIRALQSNKVGNFNLYTTLTPVLVAVYGYIFFKDRLNSYQLIGGALILGSVLAFNLLNRRQPKPKK